jgi:EmrB/QacA subfamily drug resistance transporter
MQKMPISSPVISPHLKKLLPWLVAVAFFMESLDATILNTAVPVMAKALGVVPLSMKSVLSSYTLSLAVFIPVSSWVADRYGTRRVFASAIGIFTLGSLLCGIANDIHLLVLCRILQGCGGAMMVPVGRLTLVRSFKKSELVRTMSFVAIPALIGPMVGPLAGGLIVGFLHWRMIFFVNLPIGFTGLYLVHRYLPDYREDDVERLDIVGLVLFGSGIALLSYVLEVFGETTLRQGEIYFLLGLAALLLMAYGFHARSIPFPVLRLGLLKVRTLRAAVGGNFFTRLGAGGIPFLLPLLYQVGLGYSPIQSGLLIMPQPLAAICFRLWMPQIIRYFGYRKLLLFNTIAIGICIMVFATVGRETPIWVIVLQASAFGFFSSLQYTSMSTLAYADVENRDTSMASTILSTVQQLSLSFGVATASLITAVFITDRFHASTEDMIHGMHSGFLVLGAVTILSAIGFAELKPDDGDNVSLHNLPRS